MTTTAGLAPSFVAWRSAFRRREVQCPWPGPRPLNWKDNDAVLCGRDDDCRRFRSAVDANRLVTLTGVSGVGKTSLLLRGLVPELRESGYFVGVCRDWSGTADADDAVDYLARTVRRGLLDGRYDPWPDGADFFWALNGRHGERAVIVLDQFEELARAGRDTRSRAFRDELFDVLAEVNRRTSIKLVVSFRQEHLHEVEAFERQAAAYSTRHYLLEPVAIEFVPDLVHGGNLSGHPNAIDEAAEKEVVALWMEAVDASPTSTLSLLFLQAFLYALHASGEGAEITLASIERYRAARRIAGASSVECFEDALRAAVDVKIGRCRSAAQEVGVDTHLLEGTASLLGRVVGHLSSGGFKLLREARDLAGVVMAAELNNLRQGMRGRNEALRGTPDGPVSPQQEREIFDVVLPAVLGWDGTDVAEGDDRGAVAGDGDSRVDLLNVGRAEVAKLADEIREREGGRLREVSWVERLHLEATAPINWPEVTSGPMLGMPPAAVYIEEVRRFAFALAWLHTGELVRLTSPGRRDTMVALVHDGFGSALEGWSKEISADPSGALYALTAPKGADFWWVGGASDPDLSRLLGATELGGGFLPEFDGNAGALEDATNDAVVQPGQLGVPPGRVLVNLRWRGASVHAAFRHVAFVNCDLRGTYFMQCLFAGVSFVNCLLDGAMFSDCVIVGAPSEAGSDWSLDAPQFLLPVTDDRFAYFAQYRREDPSDERKTSRSLLLPVAGRPAVLADEAALTADLHRIGVEPGGLVFYGGRISSLTVRSAAFADDGCVSFRETAGSGLEVVEVQSGARYEIAGSTLRHVAFSRSREGADESHSLLDISVVGSAVAQMWIGSGLRGRFDSRDSMLLHLWNGSPAVHARVAEAKYHGLVNVEIDPEAKGTALIQGEEPYGLQEVDPDGDALGRATRMDYVRNAARIDELERARGDGAAGP